MSPTGSEAPDKQFGQAKKQKKQQFIICDRVVELDYVSLLTVHNFVGSMGNEKCVGI